MTKSIFENRQVKKMFEKENYTSEEFRNFMRSGGPIDSRHNKNISYILKDAQIKVIEKR